MTIARGRFNVYGPLIRLGRYDEARALLLTCRRTFEEEGGVADLGKLYSALADLESNLGRYDLAIQQEESALRYKYVAGRPDGCAISHFNLANHLSRGGGQQELTLAHRLAAAILRLQGGSGRLTWTVQQLTGDLASFAPNPPPLPSSFADLCSLVDQVEGVRFAELFARLPNDRAASGDDAMRQVLCLALSGPESRLGDLRPICEGLAEAAAGGTDKFEGRLSELRDQLLEDATASVKQVDDLISRLRHRFAQEKGLPS